jgi:ankyrin repeat protein
MSDPLAIHKATVAGDLDALRRAYGGSTDFPNVRNESGTWCLEYAIYHGPIALVRTLLDIGADPNYDERSFPSLFAVLDRAAPDKHEVLALLLEAGANVQQRGTNDYTALHQAACRHNAAVVELLLAHGADPEARTRVDDYGTPVEEAERWGHVAGAAALRRWIASHRSDAR